MFIIFILCYHYLRGRGLVGVLYLIFIMLLVACLLFLSYAIIILEWWRVSRSVIAYVYHVVSSMFI
jgi:hypothetical protein